jgi:hypothetical protein
MRQRCKYGDSSILDGETVYFKDLRGDVRKYIFSALKIQGSPYLSSTPTIISFCLINSGIFLDLMRI